jgi:hypothetical protein
MDPLSRRGFLVLAGAGALSARPPFAQSERGGQKPPPQPIPGEEVREFVIAAHGNLDKTKTLLQANQGLLNATWDWGKGDYESAIGGAGHMGRRDIAEYLLSQGARMDLFVAAMLGKLEIVKATLTAYPALKDSYGPHRIGLTRHAEMGGEPAQEVLAFLKSIGAS